MIVLGLILLIIGFLAHIPILWTIGIIVARDRPGAGTARHGRPRDRRPAALVLKRPVS